MVPSSSCANLHFPLSRPVHVGVCVCNSACRLQRLSLLVCPLLAGHLQAVEQSLTWVQSDDYSATT